MKEKKEQRSLTIVGTLSPLPYLGHNEFGVLCGVEQQFLGHVLQADPGVADTQRADRSLDDVGAQAVDEGERVVLLEPRSVLLQGGVKLLQVAVTDRCRERRTGRR